MPRFFTLLFPVLFAMPVAAQNYPKRFSQLLSQKDTTAQWQLLQQWKEERPDDAELFIAYFNYYFSKSRVEAIRIDTAADAGAVPELPDSTGAQTAGYLSADYLFDSNLLQKGFQCIDAGIDKYPARLDMRFGKIYALGQIENYEVFTSEIIKTIDCDNQNRHQWTWTDNVRVDSPRQFFLQAIQDYVVQLYNAGDEQLTRMQQVARAVLKYYPDHVESLSNLAITLGLQGNYDGALDALLKAEKKAPGDAVVLNNIAYMYEQKGDTPRAIKYYELTARHSDKDARAAIAKKLKKLRG
jgi:tetratricopeptide (TPR) repeat protein